MDRDDEVVAARGAAGDGAEWVFTYGPAGGEHGVRLVVDGTEISAACGFEIPRVTKIGFDALLRPGKGHYFLYGLVTSRIRVVRAEGRAAAPSAEVETAPLAGAFDGEGAELRTFVIVRPPVDDVGALVGLDRSGEVVQRISFS